MNDWEKFVKVALLGSRREALAQDGSDSPLTQMLERLQGSGPAHELLCAAGTTDLYEQVGQFAERVMRETAVPQVHDDERLPCSARAGYYLSRMLSGPFRSLLPEFLDALQQSGLRVPDTLMPNLLTHGAKVVDSRPLIISLLSDRDRYLASQNPAWSYASRDMDSWPGLRRIWDDLAPVKRQSLIKQLRATAPDQGRELLESTWKIDAESQRIRLLRVLESGLSMNDEPFLETALDDRNHQIRLKAAELLAYLPESRLCRRMAGRVARFLVWTPDREQQISARFPVVDPPMARDGVIGSKSSSLARIRSQQLIQMVGAVPLTYWTDEWHESPEVILRAVITSHWTRTLFAGFAWAAYRQKDAVWAKAILRIHGLEGSTSKLLDLLGADDYKQLIIRLLQAENGDDPLDRRSPLVTALRRRSDALDAELTQLLLPLFIDHFKQEEGKKSPGSLVRSSFLKLARTCPPELSATMASHLTPIAETTPLWRSTILEFLHILQFREGMLGVVGSEQ